MIIQMIHLVFINIMITLILINNQSIYLEFSTIEDLNEYLLQELTK